MINCALAAALVALATAPGASAQSVQCRFTDQRLTEISGMTMSRIHPDVLWVHNDSSGGPFLYAVNVTSCRTIARISIRGIAARDLEGLASGVDQRGRPVLWLGDIGDNRDSWPWVWVHRIPEPRSLVNSSVTARSFRFTYPDGSHNAEAILADPRGPRVWVVTKGLARSDLFALPVPLRTKRVNIASMVRSEGPFITDGAVAPNGRQYVLRDYASATIFEGLPPGRKVKTIALPIQPQGEAITWTADSSALLVASERDPRLFWIPVD